ncbi:MAG TPA: transposase [Candidatus Acidoferrum sp.]|nr:transposase [Candidatus Acidoferrum sp.]
MRRTTLPLRLEDRGPTRAFWRSHFEVWELSGLTQREYCERHGLNLKNFGNWRGQLKREDAVGPKARWGRYPRLRPSSGPSSRPGSERPRIERPKPERLKIEKPAPTVVTEPGRRRRFSEDAKRRIAEETCQPGVSVSRVARQYGITTSLLFRWRQALGVAPSPGGATFLPVQIADDAGPAVEPRTVSDPPSAPPIIVERVAAGIEIELIGGRRVRFDRDVDPETMKRVVLALEEDRP